MNAPGGAHNGVRQFSNFVSSITKEGVTERAWYSLDTPKNNGSNQVSVVIGTSSRAASDTDCDRGINPFIVLDI